MKSISDMPEKWAESDKKTEAEAFELALESCMEVPTRAVAKLVEENEELRRQLREQASQIQNLRECIRRTQEEWYD